MELHLNTRLAVTDTILFEFNSFALRLFIHRRHIMTKPIFLNAVLQEKIWGGTKLHSLFNFTLPSDKTGEAWIISAHPNGISTIKSPDEYAGLGLDELYKTHPELFNGQQLASFSSSH